MYGAVSCGARLGLLDCVDGEYKLLGGGAANAAAAAALIAGFVLRRSAMNSGVNAERSKPRTLEEAALGGAGEANVEAATWMELRGNDDVCIDFLTLWRMNTPTRSVSVRGTGSARWSNISRYSGLSIGFKGTR